MSYILPPPQTRSPIFSRGGPKLDPFDPNFAGSFVEAVDSRAKESTIEDTLIGLVQGCGPSVARDVAARSGLEVSDPISSIGSDDLARACLDHYQVLLTRDWRPAVIAHGGQPQEYRAHETPGRTPGSPAGSMSQAIESVLSGVEAIDSLAASRRRVQSAIGARRMEIKGKIESLKRGLESGKDSAQLREWGDYILAYKSRVISRATELDLPELDMRIPLDPTKSPVENAERYYRRFQKAKRAAAEIPKLLTSADLDFSFVEDLAAYADLAETAVELERVEEELNERFGRRREPSRKKRSVPASPLTIQLPGVGKILVGRSARQNDLVTFKLAQRHELWFHARGVPGAHVVLQGIDQNQLPVGDDASIPVRTAASLAAYFSKARSESYADVIVAKVRDVRHVPGGNPGQVTVRESRTIRVAPAAPPTISRKQ